MCLYLTSRTSFFLLKNVCVVMVTLRQGNRKQICTYIWKGIKKNQDITGCYVYIETTFLDFKCLFREESLQWTVVDIMYINQYWLMDYVAKSFVMGCLFVWYAVKSRTSMTVNIRLCNFHEIELTHIDTDIPKLIIAILFIIFFS